MTNLVVGMRITYFILFLAFCGSTFAQDTIQMMHYNLLNYRNSTNECDGTTNNASAKDGYLKLIVKDIKPDIISCNEMGSNIVNASRILDNALNVDGINYFDQAQFTNNSFSSLTNMLFYNINKFGLKGQDIISKDMQNGDLVRVIDVYKLYFKKSAFAGSDTIFFHVIVGHLKAGNTSSDQVSREKMTAALMDYLYKQPKKYNYIFAGDFNTQSSSENSFKNLVNPTQADLKFYDPVDALGNWNNNSNYANVHTQSTRSSSSNSCFSSGGMDDRYDFILMNGEINFKRQGVSYIANSYKAYGNDGGRFNGDVNGSTNNSLSKTLLDALFNMSDHVPVVSKFEFKQTSNALQKFSRENFRVKGQFTDEITIFNQAFNSEEYTVALFDMTGQQIFEEKLKFNQGILKYKVAFIKSGLYTLTLTSKHQEIFHFRLIKQDEKNP